MVGSILIVRKRKGEDKIFIIRRKDFKKERILRWKGF